MSCKLEQMRHLLVFLPLLACGPAPKRIVDPGSPELLQPNPPLCSRYPNGEYCPGMSALFCRLDGLIAANDGPCVSDSDCSLADPVPNCIGYGECGRPSVLTQNREAFSAGLRAELEPWCKTSNCRSASYCAVRTATAQCVAGRCASRYSD